MMLGLIGKDLEGDGEGRHDEVDWKGLAEL